MADQGNLERPIEMVTAAREMCAAHRWAEAAELIARALDRAPRHRGVLATAATIAEQTGDTEAALRHYATLRAHYPKLPAGYVGALRCLRRLRRLDLAEPILRAGTAQVTDNRHFVLVAAQIASAGHKYEVAEALWQRASSLWPDRADHALSAALAPMAQRRGRAARLPAVLVRLQDHHTRFPDHVPAFIAHLNVLREARQTAEAGRLAAIWCARFPDHLALATAWAGVLEDDGDFSGALAVARRFRARNGQSAGAEAMLTRALSCAGAAEEAEVQCTEARRLYPADPGLWLEYARLASRRGDWPQSVARLKEACALFPASSLLARALNAARLQLAEPPEEPGDKSGTIFDRFESLGGSGMGCEFGMVQARFGSNRIGLLRWARTNPAELTAAITSGFAGVGDPETTIVRAGRGAAGQDEYVTGDTRYLMESHTFVRLTDAPSDRMFQQTCRRLRFLRDKLLEDLRTADRILVYRCEHAIDDAQALGMHTALTRFGDNALLCVMRAPPGIAGGTLRRLGRGAYVGYVRYFALDQDGGGAGSDLDGWSSICRLADAAWVEDR